MVSYLKNSSFYSFLKNNIFQFPISLFFSSPTNEASPIITVNCTSTQTSRDELGSVGTSLTSDSSKGSIPLNRNNLTNNDKLNEDTNEIIDAIINENCNKQCINNLRLNLLNDDSPTDQLQLITVKMKPDKEGMFGFNVKACLNDGHLIQLL